MPNWMQYSYFVIRKAFFMAQTMILFVIRKAAFYSPCWCFSYKALRNTNYETNGELGVLITEKHG